MGRHQARHVIQFIIRSLQLPKAHNWPKRLLARRNWMIGGLFVQAIHFAIYMHIVISMLSLDTEQMEWHRKRALESSAVDKSEL